MQPEQSRSSEEQPTVLILVRHAETESNVNQRWYGALDAPLTERGRAQVAATAAAVAELTERYPPDVFYVSPLPRAQSTAAAIADAIDMPPAVEDELREFDLGDWEGRTFQDLRETEDLWGRWAADPSFAPPNGESPASFSQRVEAALQNLVARHPGETVLIVSHGAVIGNVLTRWLGDGKDWRRWDPPNCSITVLERGMDSHADESAWKPILVNDVSHLQGDAA
jgi:broad specificity phosphatase PhoE